MQPELSGVNPQIQSITQSSESQSATAQHGFHSSKHHHPHPLPYGEGDDATSFLLEDGDLSTASNDPRTCTDDAVEWMSRGGPPGSPLSPVTSITEHRYALTPPRKRNIEKLEVKATARATKPSGAEAGSPITVVPNGELSLDSASEKPKLFTELMKEILTHILSYLEPPALSAISSVSRNFHDLVKTPHAWRIAFSRFFPGNDLLATPLGLGQSRQRRVEHEEFIRSDKRLFTRLTALASWRSEYILRTRLLRSLARGKPAPSLQLPRSSTSSRPGSNHIGNATVTYNSQLFTTVNHLEATFGSAANKKLPRFIHGADEIGLASSSDPTNGKVDAWGSSDPQTFSQFADRFPGDTLWGLGSGEIVGVPNVMDLSQPFGMIYGEGFPGGSVYYRAVDEMKGRVLLPSISLSATELGIPKVHSTTEAVCSVCIAKSGNIPTITEGVVGMMAGSSSGVLTAYSLGTEGHHDQRIGRGEMTARWVLSPGVPVIAIAMDNHYSVKRQSQGRIWAVALNALGEAFHLTSLPRRKPVDRGSRVDDGQIYRLAWLTGRSSYWSLIEPSRRVARPSPYAKFDVDSNYSPRSSWTGMSLSEKQIIAETREIEAFMEYKPKHFQKICSSWDMRRKLEVDFAGDDGNGAGEAIAIICCGLDQGAVAGLARYTRRKFSQENTDYMSSSQGVAPHIVSTASPSLFPTPATGFDSEPSTPTIKPKPRHAASQIFASYSSAYLVEEWRISHLVLGGYRSVEITAIAVDSSIYACLTIAEDPLMNMSGLSTASSPMVTPAEQVQQSPSTSDVPGQRSRFFAAGTKSGKVLIWDLRAPTSDSTDIINDVAPVRIIHTESPQIHSLAISALYLVHGGNDGLVQTWDVLASDTCPVRTLNSRFSSRARRRLMQAEASIHGVGVNLFAAGAIVLHPDPTVLCGMVSLGTHLFYWSYSSSAVDQYKGKKRNLRRSQRGNNHSGERFRSTGRGALKEYIANEKIELENQKRTSTKEADRMAGRFGIDLLGRDATEAEILAYATMLSEESLVQDVERRSESSLSSSGDRIWQSESVGSEDSREGQSLAGLSADDGDDDDASIAEAIRLSLKDGGNDRLRASSSMSIIASKYVERPTTFSPPSSHQRPVETDLNFALQLSLAEEQSRNDLLRALVGRDNITDAIEDNGKKRVP